MIQRSIYDLSIVLVGEFNPVIISPAWLYSKGLISETESTEAVVEVIHNEISKFELPWVSFEVTRQKFVVRTSKESFFAITKDIVTSIFRLLRHTPLTMLGLNHNFHYECNEKQYLEIGKKLVPFDNWDDILKNPRLANLEMIEMPRDDQYNGKYRMKIAPSDLIKPYGVTLQVNDHYASKSNPLGVEEIINTLENSWDSSQLRASKTSQDLWKRIEI